MGSEMCIRDRVSPSISTIVVLVNASTEVTKKLVLLPESAPESFEQKIKYVLGKYGPMCFFRENSNITLVVTSKI